MLGLEEFDGAVFTDKVEKIVVPEQHRLVFHMKDGTIIDETWEPVSRKEYWTPERRAERSRQYKGRSHDCFIAARFKGCDEKHTTHSNTPIEESCSKLTSTGAEITPASVVTSLPVSKEVDEKHTTAALERVFYSLKRKDPRISHLFGVFSGINIFVFFAKIFFIKNPPFFVLWVVVFHHQFCYNK